MEEQVSSVLCTRNGCEVVDIHHASAPLKDCAVIRGLRLTSTNQPQLELGVAEVIIPDGPGSRPGQYKKGQVLVDSGAAFTLVT